MNFNIDMVLGWLLTTFFLTDYCTLFHIKVGGTETKK